MHVDCDCGCAGQRACDQTLAAAMQTHLCEEQITIVDSYMPLSKNSLPLVHMPVMETMQHDSGLSELSPQGFTRPKVLLLLPQRNFAYRAIVRLVRLAMAETRADSVQGKAKFVEQFGDMNPEDEDEMDGRLCLIYLIHYHYCRTNLVVWCTSDCLSLRPNQTCRLIGELYCLDSSHVI